MDLILEQSSKSFDGYQYVYSHESWTTNNKIKFGIYVPSNADEEQAPLLIFLSDKNSTEQSFITKSGIQRLASKYGFIVANPDISADDYEGYIAYVNDEFYELIIQNFNVDINRIGILGHGIGGHGALISFLKHPAQYKSVSALAPVYNLSHENEERWKEYNLCELVEAYHGPLFYAPILIDENCDNECKEKFLQSCTDASFPIQFREQIGYDNSYYFLSTFLEDHIKYHQKEFENSD